MKPFSDKPSVAFEPIERSRVFEVICDQIQECLAAGSLVPGMKLYAGRQLARRFGVSRTAVREAMQFDPELATKLSQFFVGGLYQREVITKRERQLCVVGAAGPSLRGRAARAYPCGAFR
jgi:hypothetical protein